MLVCQLGGQQQRCGMADKKKNIPFLHNLKVPAFESLGAEVWKESQWVRCGLLGRVRKEVKSWGDLSNKIPNLF